MHVICLEEPAFYDLFEKVLARLQAKQPEERNKWIDEEKAMAMLNIKSKTTLQKLRDEGKIEFSQPSRKIILYSRPSIEAYLESNSRKPF